VPVTIRRAAAADERALSEVDRLTWSSAITPQERWSPDRPFFGPGVDPDRVLVAELGDAVVGYVTLGPPTALRFNQHVLKVQGLAIAPAYQRQGIARALMRAAIAEAKRQGVLRLRLRVLATNEPALRLYRSIGFEAEGRFRNEFLLDGRYVDDVLLVISVQGSTPHSST
jgi:ribosomal protein S18 acetylase RimI-like enzyme